MVARSPLEEFSWDALVSNFVSKHGGSKVSGAKEPQLELELEEERSEANQEISSSEARDDVDCSQPQACTPFDEASCVPFDERSCTPRTTAEMKMDLKSIRQDIAEIVKEHKRFTEDGTEAGESPSQEKCVHFSLDCNPESVASKEERKKPVIDRKDDTLDYIFNLVEIAICGDKKSNIDEEVTKIPTKKEQMPDPVKLLREKSIFQTLNPGGASSNSKKRSSHYQKNGETSDKSATEENLSTSKTVDKVREKQEKAESTKSETATTAISKHEESTTDSSTIQISKPQVSTIEARELRALRLKAASTILTSEAATSIPITSKSEVTEPEHSKTSPPIKVDKSEETIAGPGLDAMTIDVPPTIPEEPSDSQETAFSQQEEKKKFVEEVAMAVLAEAQAMAAGTDVIQAETDASVSIAPQSTVHVDGSHDTVSQITDVDEYSHSLPRIIHLSNSEANQTSPTKPSKIYSPSIRKLQNRKSVSSALAAYNKKMNHGVNFGGSTRVLGKQGSTTTNLVRRNNAENEQVIQLLAGLLSVGKNSNINTPGTARGVIFLASVVSFLFWPEDLPKEQMVQKTKPIPIEDPMVKNEVPSLLSLVGDKKPKRTLSPVKRNRPRGRPQLSSKRMNASTKKSFDV